MSDNLNSKALKSGVWYTLSSFLLKAIGFLTTPIFTRMLSHEDFGMFSNFTSVESIFAIIISLNLTASLITAKYDYKNEFNEFVYTLVYLEFLSCAIWMLCFLIFGNVICNLVALEKKYLYVLVIYIFFSSVFSLFQSKHQLQFRYRWNALFSLVNSIASTLLSVLLVCLLPNRLVGRLLGFVLPIIIIGIIAYLLIGREASWKIKNASWRYAVRTSLPYIPHSLSLMILSAMDKVMITKICGAEENAIYSIAYTCGAILTVFISSMNNAFVPWLGEKLNEHKYQDVRKFSKEYISGFMYLSFGLILFTPEILLIMGGRSYYEAKSVMTPVSLGIIFQFMYTMYVNVEQFMKNTKKMATASFIAAMVNLVTNSYFIPRYGYTAAAYTTAFSYFILLLIHMLIVKGMECSEVYDNRIVFFTVLLATLICAMVAFSYNFVVFRIILIILYIAISCYILKKNKEKIYRIFDKFKTDRRN